jgi:signal peptidase II
LKGENPIQLIKGVLEFRYLENCGAAFGSMQGRQMLLLIVTAVVLAGLILGFRKIPKERRFFPLRLTFLLLFAGAIGNMIDRLLHQYVVDFIYIKWIDFPIFNVADCYVTVAAAMLIVLVVFVYKEEELSFWGGGKERKKK